jgi:hypothetical protein
LDADEATAMTLLSDDGLDATYLASNLRPGHPQQGGPGRSVTERLAELESLKQQRLVTQAEYDERRAVISARCERLGQRREPRPRSAPMMKIASATIARMIRMVHSIGVPPPEM